MTPYGFLKFIASIRGLNQKTLKKALERTIALCNLESVLFQPIDTLSKGFFQRLCLAQAIIHDPPILILDEPTNGLDPNQKHQTRKLIKKMGKNKTIIISTHILEEVDACCSRVMIISRGKLVADSTPSKLTACSDTANTLILEITDLGRRKDEINKRLKTLPHLSKLLMLTESKDKIKFRLYPDKTSNIKLLTTKAIELIQKANWPISDIKIDKGNLGEVFRKITK